MNYLLFAIYLLFIICHLSFPAQASLIPGNDLIENAASYEGKLVEFQGEVVGDIMARGKYAWINVNDGQRAIGIWVEKSLIQDIKTTGSYNYIGDKIKATGIFHRACPEHGGDLDIHAQNISINEKGYKVEHPISQAKIVVALFLLVAVLAAIFYPRFLPRG